MRRVKNLVLWGAFLLASGCASIVHLEPIAGAVPAEISATSEDAFTWRDRAYSVDGMGDAIRAAKRSEGVTSVVLLCDQEDTVQVIINVALIARIAGVPAFYQKDGKLNHIEVSR